MKCEKCGSICKSGTCACGGACKECQISKTNESRVAAPSYGAETRTTERKQSGTVTMSTKKEDMEKCGKTKKKHTPIVSEAQRRLFGAVLGGNKTAAPSLSKEEAKRHLKEVAGKKLPEKVKKANYSLSLEKSHYIISKPTEE